MAATVQLRAQRALWHRGQVHGAGELLSATVDEAASLLASGRATLEREGDAAAVRQAAQQQTAALLRQAGRAPELPPGPWLPLR